MSLEKNLYKPKTSGEKALTKSQVEKLLSAVTDINDLALFKLAISTGIRREDIVRIRTADVDTLEQTITFFEGKKNANHIVPVSRGVMNTIGMSMNAQRDKWLFPSNRGTKGHISGKTAYNKLHFYMERAGIPKKPFHALRATCAKLCQANGWPVERTAKLLNDTIKTIQGHYTTPSNEEMKEIAEEKAIL